MDQRSYLLAVPLLCLLLTPVLCPSARAVAQSMDLEAEFFAAQAAMEKEYRDFEREAFERFRREVEAMWNDFKVSTRKDWVEYSGDRTGRSRVDFEIGEAVVEVLVPREEARRDPAAVRKRLEEELERLVADRGKTRDYDVPVPGLPVDDTLRMADIQEMMPQPPVVAPPVAKKPPAVPEPAKVGEHTAALPRERPTLRERMERMEEMLTFPEEKATSAPVARQPVPAVPEPPPKKPSVKERAEDIFSLPEPTPAPAPVARKPEPVVSDPPPRKPPVSDRPGEPAATPAAVIPPRPLLPVPVLENQLQDREGRIVTEETGQAFAKEVVQTRPVEQEVIQTQQGEMIKAAVSVPLVPNHLRVRAERHLEDVRTHAARFKVNVPLAFAVIHTESFFNPKARSHVPAYGLMQLVPTSGGRDAYRYVYGEDRILGPDYLYQPSENIELGCAYLGLLEHRYFRNVKDPRNAMYCAIASYNTGMGNLSRALTGDRRIAPAVERINTMSPDQLYDHLVRNLPYQETRDYMKKVRDRMDLYQEWR